MRLALVSCLVFLTACVSSPGPGHRAAVAPGQPFRLALGESVGVKGGIFVVDFLAVSEDSRCPVNTQCVWEGNARIAVKVWEYTRGLLPGGMEVFDQVIELNTNGRFPTRASFGESTKGITVALRGLEPAPRTDTPIVNYVATLVVETVK
jgi:hypothetical protein